MADDPRGNHGPDEADFENADPDNQQVAVNGGRATVVRIIGIRWPYTAPDGSVNLGGVIEGTAWTYDVRHDSRGWRIWSVTMPPWCGAYSRCGTAPPTPTASPSPTEASPDAGGGL